MRFAMNVHEMYWLDCVNTSCRALLRISLQVLGRTAMRVLGSVRFFFSDVFTHVGFCSESRGIDRLFKVVEIPGSITAVIQVSAISFPVSVLIR